MVRTRGSHHQYKHPAGSRQQWTFVGAPRVTVWGSGRPRREFLHVDDLADACVFLMRRWERPDIINVGVGEDVSIAELADLVRSVVGYEGDVVYDITRPDGTPRKLLDVSRITQLGWQARTPLREGVEATYRWFVETEGRRGGRA